MMTAVKIIVDAVLDQETLHEIKMLRGIRLAHYEKMAAEPVHTPKSTRSSQDLPRPTSFMKMNWHSM
jgi:hypothetical protein